MGEPRPAPVPEVTEAVEGLPDILTVMVDRTFDGTYIPVVLLNDRVLVTLDGGRALPYAAAWADAIARAEFDAAVFAQLTGIGLDEDTARATVAYDLRPRRLPLDEDATLPLRLEPILSNRTKRGRVTAYIGEEEIIQLGAPAVYDHIAKVLPVAATCPLDQDYRQFAITVLEQPEWRADAMVGDLGMRWRVAEERGADYERHVRDQFAGIVLNDHKVSTDAPLDRMGAGKADGVLAAGAGLPEDVVAALVEYRAIAQAIQLGAAAPLDGIRARSAVEAACARHGIDVEGMLGEKRPPRPPAPTRSDGRPAWQAKRSKKGKRR